MKHYESTMLRRDPITGIFHEVGKLVPVLALNRQHAIMKMTLSGFPKAVFPDAWLCVYDPLNPSDNTAEPHSIHDEVDT